MRHEERRDKEFTNRTDTKKLSPNQVQEAHRETKDKRKQGDWKEFLEREIRELTEYGLVFKAFEKLLMLTSNNTNKQKLNHLHSQKEEDIIPTLQPQ